MQMLAILLILLASTLLACSSSGNEDEQGAGDPSPSSTSIGIPQSANVAPVPYYGEDSIEERIIRADAIVIGRLGRTTNEAVTGSGGTYDGKNFPALKFHLTVSEYLKGAGANNITALWIRRDPYDTRQEAEDVVPDFAASRDATWDGRPVIIFLTKEADLATKGDDFFSAMVRAANDYITMSFSLSDRHSKLWLPSAGTSGTGDSQEFLLAVPEAGITTTTITVGELKRRIAAINVELDAGNGSDDYRQCLNRKYRHIRTEDVRATQSNYTGPSFGPEWDGAFASGQPTGSEVYEYDYGYIVMIDGTEEKTGFFLDGEDATLFSITEGIHRPRRNENEKSFTYSVVSARPIPAGNYGFNHNYIPYGHLACGHTTTFEMTVSVPLPDGALHELLFDPVTVGTTVAADDTNGVLKPATFTGANGSSATLSRIAWESGTVKINVTPDGSLMGHIVDFIEQDGTVSLSLDVAAATVDTVNDSLSWTVGSQPWQSSDQLMVRIRRDPPSCSGGVVVPNPGSAPDLVKDCEALLWIKDTLEGTGSLNWGVDMAITGWDGVTVGGSPQQITGLDLSSRSLNGIIQSKLAELGGLSNLNLSNNQLMGEIPFELGDLTDLSRLRLAGNGFSGCIPPTLREVSDHDLGNVHLEFCGDTPPSPQGLSVAVTDVGFDISCSRLTGVSQYQVHYRSGGSAADWINHFLTVNTTQTFNPEAGLSCGISYDFRVRAEGDGTVYIAEWSDWSQPVTVSTGECETPMLGAT